MISAARMVKMFSKQQPRKDIAPSVKASPERLSREAATSKLNITTTRAVTTLREGASKVEAEMMTCHTETSVEDTLKTARPIRTTISQVVIHIGRIGRPTTISSW